MTDETKTADAPAPNAPDTSGSSAIPAEELGRLTDDIVGALKTVYDPEIPADIYELGLIYRIDLADDRAVTVDMTLTTPNCPSAQELPIRAGAADHGGERGRQRGGRRRGEGQHRVGSALGPEPHDRRGA